jgi:hypothetical protein
MVLVAEVAASVKAVEIRVELSATVEATPTVAAGTAAEASVTPVVVPEAVVFFTAVVACSLAEIFKPTRSIDKIEHLEIMGANESLV